MTGSTDLEKRGSDGSDLSPARAGATDLGAISISDTVVQKIAAQAATEHPDAGSAAITVLGRAVPGAGRLGIRGSDLDAQPKTTVEVDGSKAFVSLTLSIRWSCSIATVTHAVREHVRSRVNELTGLSVDEVHITVSNLVTNIAAPPRVR